VACASNHRQLGLAFQLYLDGNDNTFPTGAAPSGMGAHAEDWVWWQLQSGPDGRLEMRPGQGSALAPVLGGFNERLFRCPADRDALGRELAWKRDRSQELYTFSYSLNAHTERGMASYLSRDRLMKFLNKHTSIVNPAGKIMLAEEKGSVQDGPGTAVINDGRWQPLGYPLTMRHAGQANVSFADGHVERVHRSFADATRPEHWDPGY
jgi:prepilin-type processing-associated H-X9-DG protein